MRIHVFKRRNINDGAIKSMNGFSFVLKTPIKGKMQFLERFTHENADMLIRAFGTKILLSSKYQQFGSI